LSNRLRMPIRALPGRRLRILIYARYSTEEQDASSIADQIDYCKKFLTENGITDADIIERMDPETSGELVSRPGINQVRDLIGTRAVDVLMCEDTSRLFRHVTACGELIETAVDLDIRVIAINDDMDTAEEDWDDRLHEAAQHHARSNKYTARRIKRRQDALWRMGAAIGLLKTGYRRNPSTPATATEPAKGPFFDEIDPRWQPIIREAFERIHRRESARAVAQWLTEQKLPKVSNSKTSDWTERNVIALIQNPIYRGVEHYRVTVVHKQRRTGKHVQQRNARDEILTRDMPHLRIIEDWLWNSANQAIDERTTRKQLTSGLEHPLHGIPRDSRGPLSQIFFCVCGAKMYMDGRNEGGYRCSNARKGLCNNRASPLRSVVHAKLGKAIADRLLSLDGHAEVLAALIAECLQDTDARSERRVTLKGEERKLTSELNALADAVAKSTASLPTLLEHLAKREHALAQNRAEQERLELEESLRRQIPNQAEIKAKLKEMTTRLLDLGISVGPDLRRLIGRIRAVPYQQFGSTKVVLRAHFDLNLVALLPDQLLTLLRNEHVQDLACQVKTVPMVVDLFEPTGPAKYWSKAMDLADAGHTSDQIASALLTNRATANRSVQYGRALRAAGLTDPYIELTEIPEKLGRWRKRRAPQFAQNFPQGTEGPNESYANANVGMDGTA
jgi:DNA invertase Pin-like site-specific DNA recombinase